MQAVSNVSGLKRTSGKPTGLKWTRSQLSVHQKNISSI